jgi:ABC-2 type transport system ATP-binding protein
MDEAEHCDRIALIIAGEIIALDSPERLRGSLPYEVYSLKVENFIRVFEYISSLDFIEEAAIFGSDIHVLCKRGFPLKKELRNILRQSGISGYRIEKIQPTLEDVFVTHSRRYGQ